ncbi:hypothetical protein, partial [Prevotella jejuni]|uniref:hypothetical protein n=1 Tax=Prevotella jejuni TaxID=1177574 RepID=UPI0028DC0B76
IEQKATHIQKLCAVGDDRRNHTIEQKATHIQKLCAVGDDRGNHTTTWQFWRKESTTTITENQQQNDSKN